MNRKVLANGISAAMMMAAAMPADMCAGEFSLKGEFQGLPDSIRITLADIEDANGKAIKIAETTSTGGTFNLSGNVASPRMCTLSLAKYSPQKERFMTILSIPVMLENADYTVGAAVPVDSLTGMSFPSYSINVTGGTAQEQLNHYRRHTGDADMAAKEASYKKAEKYFDTNDNRDTMIKYEALTKAAEANLAALRKSFITEHPDYHISAYLTQKELETQFRYTADEINAMAAAVNVCPDTARVTMVEKRRKFALKYALGMKYPDFAITSAEGSVAQVSSHIVPGKYNFIDFWASWCGPCRSAIPHVKELQERYADRLNIVSISLDEDKDEWRKAMNEEKMTWLQLRAEGDQMKNVAQAYFINTIPRLILINDKGEVVCSTNRPDDVTEYLENNLQ